MFPALGSILLMVVIVKYPVMNALHVMQPDLIESLSIPTQQIAAVLCNDRELSEEQRELIENVIDTTYIKELYNPTFADNMKELVRAGNQEYLAAHKGEYLKLWAQLGLAYPGDYMKAYINQTYGYWYPDSFYLVAEGEGISATELGEDEGNCVETWRDGADLWAFVEYGCCLLCPVILYRQCLCEG